MPLSASLEPVAGWLEAHRMLKSEAEIEAIRRSVAINSKAFDRAVRHIRAGMREQELAAEIDHQMRRLGRGEVVLRDHRGYGRAVRRCRMPILRARR